MIQLRSLAVAATAAALFSTTPALAATMIATYSGTIESGYDNTGVFGIANANLVGFGYVSTFTYDTNGGGAGFSDANSQYIYGGRGWGTPGESPISVATITINGVTRSIGSYADGFIYTSSTPFVQHGVDDSFYGGIDYIHNSAFPVGAPPRVDQILAPVAAPSDGGATRFLGNGDDAFLYFGNDVIYSVADVVTDPGPGPGPVPEPASWALMIAGFGMVGSAQRRVLRRRVVAATA